MKSVAMKKIEELNISILGDIEIVSSGYSDRYALLTTWMVIESESVKYRVDNVNDRAAAVLRLAGLDMTEENWSAAYQAIQSGDFNFFAMYENANVSGSVKTTTARINAGISVATGCKNLNENGIAKAQEVASDLSSDEWLVIESGLNRVNEIHRKKEKPVVDFRIPHRDFE